MAITSTNKCAKCGDSGADKYVWCDMRHDFVCFDCHAKCEHYVSDCFINNQDCKLKGNTDNRQIFVFTANSGEVAAARLTYKDYNLKQLEERWDAIHTSYLASDVPVHRAAYRVHLAAIYLEIQDKQNAYVCVHN